MTAFASRAKNFWNLKPVGVEDGWVWSWPLINRCQSATSGVR